MAYSYNNPEIIEILETVKIQKELGKLESKNTEEGTQSGFLYDINNYPSQTYLTISAINETS